MHNTARIKLPSQMERIFLKTSFATVTCSDFFRRWFRAQKHFYFRTRHLTTLREVFSWLKSFLDKRIDRWLKCFNMMRALKRQQTWTWKLRLIRRNYDNSTSMLNDKWMEIWFKSTDVLGTLMAHEIIIDRNRFLWAVTVRERDMTSKSEKGQTTPNPHSERDLLILCFMLIYFVLQLIAQCERPEMFPLNHMKISEIAEV